MANRWASGRIEAFSDGVFAIAVTLLVLDLGVPSAAFTNLWHGILKEWPAYLGYATSFLTIGALWMAHHGIFRRLAFANSAVMRVNLVLLMAVAFLPYPTRLMAQAIHNDEAERAAVVFYGASLLVISLLFWAMWTFVAREGEDLIEPGVSGGEVEAMRAAARPNVGFYVAVTGLAILAPKVAAFGYLFIAAAAVLRAHGDQTAQPVGREGHLE